MPGSLAADRMACSDNATPFPRGRQGKPRRRRSRRRALIGWGVSRRRRLAGDGHAPELVQLDGELVGGVPGLIALGDRLISRGDRGLALSDCHVALGGEVAGGIDGLVALGGERAGGTALRGLWSALGGELVGGVPGLVALGDRLISRGDRSLTLGERGFALTDGAVALVDRGVAPGHHGVALGDRRLPLGQRRVQRATASSSILDCRFLSLRGLRALQFRVRRTLHPPIAVSARTLR